MNETVALRPASAEDHELLFRIYASSRELELSFTGWNEQQRQMFLVHQFTAQNGHYQRYFPRAADQIILAGDVPVGRLWVERNDGEIRILDLIILTGHRRKGIGTKILQDLQAETERVSRPLRVNVELGSPSLSLFERLGFRSVQDEGPHLLLEWEPGSALAVQSD